MGCQLIPKIQFSKTAKNLNKVFLTCSGSAIESRCKFFSVDPRTVVSHARWSNARLASKKTNWQETLQTKTSRTLQPRESDMVATSRAKCRAVEKQQTEQAWLNQFAESTRKQNERWEAKKKAPVLPSTFQWSPEIAEVYKKREQWEDINTMANYQFQASVKNAWGQVPPNDASLASYLQKRKNKGKLLYISPADEKFSQACQQLRKPATGFWPQNEAAIAEFIHGPLPFGDLPGKVCSLASYCRKRKQQGLRLTPALERFFTQLVDVHRKKDQVSKCPSVMDNF